MELIDDFARILVHPTRFLNRQDKQRIIKLWNHDYPERLNFRDEEEFERYLESLDIHNHFILRNTDLELIGWSMVFNRDEKTWFAMIVDAVNEFNGGCTSLINHMKESFHELNCWMIDHNNELKSNGEIFFNKRDFCLNHGFTILEDVRLETAKISAVQIQWKK